MTDEERDFILGMFMSTPEVYHYVKFRAQQEEVCFELEPMFFKHHLHRGIKLFFGVETDSQGTVLTDTDSAETLARFKLEIQ